MDFRQTFQSATNRSDDSATPAPAHTQAHEGGPKRQKQGKPDLNLQNLFSVGLLVATALLVFFLVLSFLTRGNVTGEEKFVDTKKYQAVFLSNGQVYFGKIGGISKQAVDLRDVYYLTQTNTGTGGTTGDYTLVKLGCQQIHSPLDQMVVSREQVSFWENLSDEGKVVKSIKEFQKQNPNGPDCTKVSNQTQSTANPTAPGQTGTTPSTSNPTTTTPSTTQTTTPTTR